MVYIDRNGRVLEKRPWDMERIKGILTSLWFVMVQFFLTLVAPFKRETRSGGGDNNRRGGGSWGSGGGYGGGGGSGGSGAGGNSGLRPNRQIGRINNSMDCNIPGGGG